MAIINCLLCDCTTPCLNVFALSKLVHLCSTVSLVFDLSATKREGRKSLSHNHSDHLEYIIGLSNITQRFGKEELCGVDTLVGQASSYIMELPTSTLIDGKLTSGTREIKYPAPLSSTSSRVWETIMKFLEGRSNMRIGGFNFKFSNFL